MRNTIVSSKRCGLVALSGECPRLLTQTDNRTNSSYCEVKLREDKRTMRMRCKI
jgi:hypothetical protein